MLGQTRKPAAASTKQHVYFADDDDSNSDDDELDLFGEMTEEEKEAKAKKDAVSLIIQFVLNPWTSAHIVKHWIACCR